MLFNSLSLLVVNLSTAIRYNSSDIYSLLKSENTSNPLPILDDVINALEEGYPLPNCWSLAVSKTATTYRLSKEEKASITQFGYKLGTTDVNGQLEHLSYYKNIFENKASLLKRDYITKAKLYKSLGFFSGMAMVLVII